MTHFLRRGLSKSETTTKERITKTPRKAHSDRFRSFVVGNNNAYVEDATSSSFVAFDKLTTSEESGCFPSSSVSVSDRYMVRAVSSDVDDCKEETVDYIGDDDDIDMMENTLTLSPLLLDAKKTDNNEVFPSPTTTTTTMTVVPSHLFLKTLVMQDPDRYGQTHPIETPELIEEALNLLKGEIKKCLSSDDKVIKEGILEAQEKCPDIVLRDEHLLLFLRCEMFNIQLAAQRMAKYWKTRIELFGEYAFKPLTLDDALKADTQALKVGFIQLLPGTDDAGRSIVLVHPDALDESKYARESLVRANWYMLHAALERQSAQQYGILFLIHLKDVEYKQFDKTMVKMTCDAVKGIIPARISAIHMYHPPTFFAMIFPLIKLLLGARLRKRIIVHKGSNDKVLNRLGKYGILSDTLPVEIEGKLEMNHAKWLEERMLNYR